MGECPLSALPLGPYQGSFVPPVSSCIQGSISSACCLWHGTFYSKAFRSHSTSQHGCLGSPVTPVRFGGHATVLLPNTFLNRGELQTFLDTYGRTHRRVSLPPGMVLRITRNNVPSCPQDVVALNSRAYSYVPPPPPRPDRSAAYLARLLNSLQMRLSETQENLSFMSAFQTLTTTELVQGGSLGTRCVCAGTHPFRHCLDRGQQA